MISKTLVKEVVKEATKLREHATKAELNRIAVSRLRPERRDLCIYGQATGDCFSARAHELIDRCAAWVIAQPPRSDSDILTNVSCKLPRGDKQELDRGIRRYAFSPIEVYIGQKGADNKTLINFLKGKTETLDLSHTVNC